MMLRDSSASGLCSTFLTSIGSKSNAFNETPFSAVLNFAGFLITNFSDSPAFKGGAGESLKLVIKNPAKFKTAEKGVSLKAFDFEPIEVKKVEQSPEAEESLSIIELVIQFSVIAGIITANTLGGSLASMWIMLNLMQLWFMVGLVDV